VKLCDHTKYILPFAARHSDGDEIAQILIATPLVEIHGVDVDIINTGIWNKEYMGVVHYHVLDNYWCSLFRPRLNVDPSAFHTEGVNYWERRRYEIITQS